MHINSYILRKFQQTPGTYPIYPKVQIWKDSLHKQVVKGPGYVPGICWNFLRYMYMCVCMSRCLFFVGGRNNSKLRLANSKELTKVEKGGPREIFLQWISPFVPFLNSRPLLTKPPRKSNPANKTSRMRGWDDEHEMRSWICRGTGESTMMLSS